MGSHVALVDMVLNIVDQSGLELTEIALLVSKVLG